MFGANCRLFNNQLRRHDAIKRVLDRSGQKRLHWII
jgi:hypothetical protein